MNFDIVKLNQYPIYHLKFDSQYELSSTMVRVQEYYESEFPEIKGNIFTLDQFMDAYASKNGEFSYFTDWSGFNISSNSFNGFCDVFKYQLRHKEVQLLNRVKSYVSENKEKWYMIATYGEDSEEKITINHEIAHALYYLNHDYSIEMINNLGRMNQKSYEILKQCLIEDGYNSDVLTDECQAYLATSTLTELKNDYKMVDITEEDVKPFRDTLHKFNQGIK